MRLAISLGWLCMASAAFAGEADSSADSTRLVAAIVSRCGADNNCINKQIEALDHVSAYPPGSPQLALFKSCTQTVKQFEDIDWVQAERCVRKQLLTPPAP